MKLIRPYFEIEGFYMDDPGAMERIGRVCYKSEDKITGESAEKFIKARLGKHESVIEHSALTVRFICDRGVTHELVRHRLCAYSQESTRYCNYSGEVTFIIPPWVELEEGEYIGTWPRSSNMATNLWADAMLMAENTYTNLIAVGWTPQEARTVLPNSLKTEIVVTANFREWRHIFSLRCALTAHPQMRELMIPLLNEVKQCIPFIFDDL